MLLDDVRKALRLTTHSFDDEIKGLITACLADLKTGGVSNPSEKDPLIRQAVTLYCRAYFGPGDEKNSARYEKSFLALKQSLALCGDYNGP